MLNDELTIQSAKQALKKWQQQNFLLIQLEQTSVKIKQPISVDQSFLKSPFYFMHKMKKLKCDLCHFEEKFKYIRTERMFKNYQQSCLIFLICEECYHQDRNLLPNRINKNSYMPMHKFIQNIQNNLQKFRNEAQYSESIIRKYDFFEDKLSRIIRQLAKTVQVKRAAVCKQIFDQIQTLRQLYRNKKSKPIYNTLLKQAQCQCENQCCYCDYGAKNQDYLKVNCGYFNLKKQQDEIIKKIKLLNTLKGKFDGVNDKYIFEGIARQVQMIIIGQIQIIEKSLNKIIQKTQGFSLLNKNFLANIILNYNNSNFDDIQNKYQEIIQECKQKYIQQGVLNHLTLNSFPQFSNSITSISLNYMPDQQILRNKLKLLKQLNNIQVGCNEVGELLVEDTIKLQKYHNKNDKIKQILDIQIEQNIKQRKVSQISKDIIFAYQNKKDQSLIHLSDFKQLKTLSFNCAIPYKEQFFDNIDQINLEEFHINWNVKQNIQQFNQSLHFRENRNIINSVAPTSIQYQNYIRKHNLKNLWIGNCQICDQQSRQTVNGQIVFYAKIINQPNSQLSSLMFGQFDGRQRRLDDVFYNLLTQKTSLKSLFFNKIQFNSIQLQKIIKSNQIQYLYLNECEGVNQQVVDAICNLSNLRKLSIVQIQKISFKKSVPTLESFILQNCFSFSDSNITLLLKDAKLKALSLFQCRFFEDELLKDILQQQIINKSQLGYLNFGYTQITNQTLSLINNFSSINCLHIGGTNIDLSQLLTQINRGKYTNLRRLQKLSMKDMNQLKIKFSSEDQPCVSQYYNDIFSNILQYFPLLSHLDISSNKVINERAIRFGLKNLTYLTINDTLYSLKRQNDRIYHSGLECPFAHGRLSLDKDIQKHKNSQIDQKSKKNVSSFKQNGGLKIIF